MISIKSVSKELDLLKTEIELGHEMDRHDWSRLIERVVCQLEELSVEHERTEADLRDECREAYGWQDQYVEQLDHAESHIKWLEDEFADQIVECDKYERAC